MRYYARKRFDIDAAAFARAFGAALAARDDHRALEQLAAAWGTQAIATLSVRTAFDALLAAVDWPPGSEVLMSAVTIPHMASLVRLHGYVPIAIDVDSATMTISPDALSAAVTARSRAVVIAHLFGARSDTGALSAAAAAHDLLFVEDCAQCYHGHPGAVGVADVELYSFGSIKTSTCFGGAIACVRDGGLRDRMHEVLATHPRQSNTAYLLKLAKYVVLQFLATPGPYAALRSLLDAVHGDYDVVVRGWTRGFPDADLETAIRRRPSRALLAVMALRLCVAADASVRTRTAAGTLFTDLVGDGVVRPGTLATGQTYWLYPVLSDDPQTHIAAARRVGFDATTGSSTLVAIDPAASNAAALMERVVYLPVYGSIPREDLAALAAAAVSAEGPRRQEAPAVSPLPQLETRAS